MVFKKINDECQPFLIAAGDQPLFRGMNITAPANYAPHPANRKPRDSDPEFNFMFNAMIEAAFGIPQIRKISIFGTGSRIQASYYGDLYFMFPCGNIKYLWSDKISDSYEASIEYFKWIAKKFGGEIVGGYIQQMFVRLIENPKFSGPDGSSQWVKNISEAAQETHDTMVEELNYRGLDDEDLDRMKLNELNVYGIIKDAMIEMADYYYQQKFLDKAIKSKKEIFFYKTDGYYSVSLEAISEMSESEGMRIATTSYNELYDYALYKIYSSN